MNFNDASNADGATILNTNGLALARGGLTGFGVGIGGSAVLTFNDTAHADNARISSGGNGVIALGETSTADANSSEATLIFNDASHADGAIIANGAPFTRATGGAGAAAAAAVDGTPGGAATAGGDFVTTSFRGSSHADGATISNLGSLTEAYGGGAGAGGATGNGEGGTGGVATATGPTSIISFEGEAHADQTSISNIGNLAVSFGGMGGAGGVIGSGGTGGTATSISGSVAITLSGNSYVDNAPIENIAGSAEATGGLGGNAGAAGNGGAGGISTAEGGSAILTFNNSASAMGVSIQNIGGDAVALGGNGGSGGAGAVGGAGGSAVATGGSAMIVFNDTSTAGNATITNSMGTASATAGTTGTAAGGAGGAAGAASATAGVVSVSFFDSATAGQSLIINGAGTMTNFHDSSNGGMAEIRNDTGGITHFSGASTAGDATILNQGLVQFADATSGGTSSIQNLSGGVLDIDGSADLADSTVDNVGGGLVDISGATAGTGIGSLSGPGDVFLGAQALELGALGLNETFGGIISGTGSLTKAGAGTLVLTGANTYTGGTTISAGTLQIGDGGTTGSIAGDISNVAALVFDRSDDVTFDGAISGTGTLTKQGTGDLILAGNNSYTGGTTISAGTLQIGDGGTTGSIAGNIVNSSALAFDRSDVLTYGGVVSGTGTLTKLGAGTLILTGANTYTGGTTITSGTLQIGVGGTTGSIAGDVANSAALAFNRSDTLTYSGIVSGTGALTTLGAGTLVLTGENSYTGLTTISAGTLQIGDGGTGGSITGNIVDNAALAFNHSDTLTYGGVVSGTGSLTKAGTGTLILTGTNTYSGPTTITGGVLRVNGSIASAVTLSGGTLGGTGSVGGLSAGSGSTIAPGNSIGTLNVAGPISFGPGSVYQVEANAAGQADRLNATGAATLTGGTVEVLAEQGNYAFATNYVILDAQGGVTGTFANTTSNPAFLTPSLSYASNQVSLILTRNDIDFTEVADTPNQFAVAEALEDLPTDNALFLAIVDASEAQARAAFDSLSGEIYASLPALLNEDSRLARNALLANGRRGGEGLSVWGEAFGSWGDADGRAGIAEVDTRSTGFITGLAYASGGFNASLGAGIGSSRYDADDRASRADLDSKFVGGQIGYAAGGLVVQAGASKAWHDVESNRTLTLAGFAAPDAEFDATTTQFFAEASYDLVDGPMTVAPFAGFARVSTDVDGFVETGSAGLELAEQDFDTSFLSAGVRIGQEFGAGDGLQITPSLAVSYRHASGDRTGLSDARFTAGGPAFVVEGVRLPRSSVDLDAGLELRSGPFRISANYSGSFGGGWNRHGGRIALGFSF